MATGIGGKIALDGLSTFNKGMQLAAQQAKTLAAEMKAVTAQFGSSENSIAALSAKNDVLSRSLEQAKDKLSLVDTQLQKEEAELQKLAAALDKTNAEFGENSTEAAKASTAYNNQAIKVERLRTQYSQSQADVNKFSSELSKNETQLNQTNRKLDDSERSLDDLAKALDDSGDAAKDAGRGYEQAESSAGDFGDAAKKASDKGIESAAAMGAAFAVAQEVIRAAMSAIKSALGDAIKRVDTLNQFPKVMEQMGYSAGEAEASIDKLSDGVQGLPTTLDDIVTSAKQFEVVTGSLDVATDSAIALNNAFLASGASSADASRGAEQYRQMLAAGTVDAQSWRSVNETMTGSLKRVADSFGYTSTVVGGDFYTALKNGDITMQEVNARFIELNEGVGGFAEVAQTATGGIETAWSTVKTAVVRGVADMIERIDEGLGQAGLGGIEEVIKNIKVAIDNVFTTIGPMITNAIIFITNLYNKIEPYLPLIGGIITGIIAASAAFKAFTAVQAALNVVMNANPFGIIVIAIAALVAAVIYLWNNCEEFREGLIAIWEAIKKFVGDSVDAIVGFFTVTIPNGIQAMVDWFKALPGKIWNAIVSAVDGIKRWGNDMKQKALDAAKGVFNNIVNTIKSIPGKMLEIGKNIVSGIWDGIKTAASWLLGKIKDWCGSIINGIKGFFGIRSPSKLFRDEVGENLALGVGEGFTDAMPGVIRTMQSAVDGIGGELFDNMDSISVVTHPEMASGSGSSSMANNLDVSLVVNYNANNDSAEDRREFADWLEAELERRLQNKLRGVAPA